jgi:hypothetical protein
MLYGAAPSPSGREQEHCHKGTIEPSYPKGALAAAFTDQALSPFLAADQW